MKRLALAVSLALVLGACAAGAEPAAVSPLEQEVLRLADELERTHPNLFHQVSRQRFRAEATDLARKAPELSRDELVVGLMRLTALPGERDGHTGIFAFDPSHPRPLHVYPLRFYDFADGPHVVGATGRPELVGRKLASIDGTPVARVVELVRPLIPRDNESGRRLLLPEYLVTAEVLRGLGIVEGDAATYSFADGTSVTLDPGDVAGLVATLGSALSPPPTTRNPVWLQRLDQPHRLTTIDRGRAVYFGYREVSSSGLEPRLQRLALQPKIRRVIVDVRLNHGGDNTTYGSLLALLRRPAIGRKTVMLIGRGTFSAAGNFAGEVDLRTRARTVGEPSGGAPNQWGDSSTIVLPHAGLAVHVALYYVEVAPQLGTRSATVPDLPVEATAADFFAGRDPVLARALALR